MGNVATKDGLQPDQRKIFAIDDKPEPTDEKSFQRLLGMIKYLSQYISNESSITAPLRELLKKNAEWKWTETHDKALQDLKTALTSAPTLSFYDVQKPVTIQCDAS